MQSLTRAIFLHDVVGYEICLNGNVYQHFLKNNIVNQNSKIEFVSLGEVYNPEAIINSKIERKLIDTMNNELTPEWIDDFEIDFSKPESQSKFFTQSISYNEGLGRILEYDIILLGFSPEILDIKSVSKLSTLKSQFIKIKNKLKKFPGKVFVLVLPPPFDKNDINRENAKRARNFVRWLNNSDYLDSTNNIVIFNTFDLLAYPDNNEDDSNTLKYEYGTDGKLHLSLEASVMIAEELANFLIYLSKGLSKEYKIKIY